MCEVTTFVASVLGLPFNFQSIHVLLMLGLLGVLVCVLWLPLPCRRHPLPYDHLLFATLWHDQDSVYSRWILARRYRERTCWTEYVIWYVEQYLISIESWKSKVRIRVSNDWLMTHDFGLLFDVMIHDWNLTLTRLEIHRHKCSFCRYPLLLYLEPFLFQQSFLLSSRSQFTLAFSISVGLKILLYGNPFCLLQQ